MVIWKSITRNVIHLKSSGQIGMNTTAQTVHQSIERTFRQEGGRVRAALISGLGDFELAEDVLQEAFLAALEHWLLDGVPANPAAWLLTTARRKAIDRLRRANVLERKQAMLQSLAELEQQGSTDIPAEPEAFPDERLKLILPVAIQR